MENLKKKLHEVADDAVEMAQYTLDNCPKVKKVDECFPYTAYRTVSINGKDYSMRVEIMLTEMKW